MTSTPVLPAPQRPADLPTDWKVESHGPADADEREEFYVVSGEYAHEGYADGLIKICHAVNHDGLDIRVRLAKVVADFLNTLSEEPRERD